MRSETKDYQLGRILSCWEIYSVQERKLHTGLNNWFLLRRMLKRRNRQKIQQRRGNFVQLQTSVKVRVSLTVKV